MTRIPLISGLSLSVRKNISFLEPWFYLNIIIINIINNQPTVKVQRPVD